MPRTHKKKKRTTQAQYYYFNLIFFLEFNSNDEEESTEEPRQRRDESQRPALRYGVYGGTAGRDVIRRRHFEGEEGRIVGVGNDAADEGG